ncbi:MAG: hypothetical protein GXY85_01890 [Candidatus Brocadiaceae bacterium]|nr:hypothetical protein [Candidatus Brocadiaceae bacterium]
MAAEPGAAASDSEADLRAIDPARHIRHLSGYQSRFTGYPGCYEAGRYIAAEFRALGLANVTEEPFQVVVPIVPDDERWGKRIPEAERGERPSHGATLTVGSRELPLYCLFPNYVRTPMTGPDGITGNLVWVGPGHLSDMNKKEIRGNLVLMDFASDTRWVNVAKAGAAGIIFVQSPHAFRIDAEQKYMDLPVPVPRYYIQKAQLPALAAALSGRAGETASADEAEAALHRLGTPEGASVRATVRAQMRWEEMDVFRISGEIPGIDPQLADQALVVFTYYDGTSVVPALCPGAESTCGVATMLEVARYLTKHPPRRKVKFIAAPGHYQALSGVRDYAFRTMYPRRSGPNASAGQATGEPYFFIGLDLSSRHNSLGSFYKGNFYDQLTLSWSNQEIDLQRAYAEYSSLLTEWMNGLSVRGGPVGTLKYLSGIVPQQGRDWRSLVPDLMAFDSEVISLCGYPGITLATAGDPRNSVNTPQDTYEELEPYLDNVRRQAIACAHLIKSTADIPVLPIQRKDIWKQRKIGSIFGFTIELALLAYMPKTPIPNATVAVSMLAPTLTSRSKSMMGVSTLDFRISNVQGHFEVFGLVDAQTFRVDGFALSPTDGVVSKVAQSELVAASARAREADWTERETDVRMNFFRAVCNTIFDLIDPLSLATLGRTIAVRGESNSEFQPDELVSFVGQQTVDDPFSKPLAVYFTRRDRNVKYLMAATAVGNEGLLLNYQDQVTEQERSKREKTGIGYRADQTENFIYLTGLQTVQDMHSLDAHRMDRLTQSGIYKTRVWELYDQAEAHIHNARREMGAGNYDTFYDNVNMAWALENRVYPDVRDTATDVVKGVVFYFALLLPFVIFAERLLLNVVDIRKKLLAIACLFVLSYIVLRLVHPAFQLSETPIIILDGFFMLVAALGVIWYLLAKFNIVMEHLRQKVDMIHRADVARASATMAAFILGISNMRKRKVRTGLTAATLILLTFTILSFTSFETMPTRMLEYASPREAPYEGVLLRGLGWGPLPEFVAYDMMNFFRVRGMDVAPRSWFVNRKKTEELQIEISRVGGEGEAVANAILGLTPEEAQFSGIHTPQYLSHGWFDRSAPDWPFVCIVPTRMKENLRLEDSDMGRAYISVMGRQLRVIGSINSDELFRYEDVDDEEITPVDFVAQQYREGQTGTAAGSGGLALSATGEMDVETFVHRKSAQQEEEEQYVHMEPDRVLFIPNELNLKLGGTVRSIAAGPGRTGATSLRPFRQVLQELLSRVNLALYAGYSKTPGGTPQVHRVATRARLSMGGLKGLVVPIMIAALIVFNTMLGAVYERIGEIKTYASVGLAPVHIGALFFAESCVFAVMGAMLGYLLGQVISRGLVHVPALMEGISLNYSSVSAVWSALAVVVVVLLSTAYPARMAGKLSVPDETRRMTIAKPTSDVWEIWFPFTVSSHEALGVISYLYEYFESNDEDAVGSFTSADLAFYEETVEGSRRISMEATVWVAPLDMGVSQSVKISSVPDAEQPDITYLYFVLTRKSGEFQTWHRMNLGFLKDLRKQLLIWRLVTTDAKKRLTAEGRARLSGQAVQTS